MFSFSLSEFFFPAHIQGDSPLIFLLLACSVEFTAEKVAVKKIKRMLENDSEQHALLSCHDLSLRGSSFKTLGEQQHIFNNSCSLIKHWWLCLDEFYFKQKCVLNVSSNNKLSENKSCLFPQLVQNMAVDSVQISSIPLMVLFMVMANLSPKPDFVWIYPQ